MTVAPLPSVISELRRLISRQGGCSLTDAQLLDDFVKRGEQASFEVLVWRHGTMIFNLCRRILRDSHDAEDAFQATFLVFARKASTIGKREAVGSWLYKVAYRIALRVRARGAKHGKAHAPVDNLPARELTDEVLWRDLRPVLDEEIERLPEKYRVPFVLCYLEGHTNEAAAEQLGCPKGTILSRLARGRARLQSRLTRRGVALPMGGLVLALSQNAATAAAPASLMRTTIEAATAFAAGKTAAGLVSASVAALTDGVFHAMFLTKLKLATAALLALAVLGTGTGLFVRQALASRTAPAGRATDPVVMKERAAEPAAINEMAAELEANERPAREEAKAPDVTGRVGAVAKDGKSITLLSPPETRGDEPKRTEIKLDDKTTVVYQNVGTDAAQPTEGYGAAVQLKPGSKDIAASVIFQGTADGGRRGADVSGSVTAIAKDSKGVRLEVSRGRGRGEEPRDGQAIDLKFNDKTVVLFSGVGKNGAKLTEGYEAHVWLEDGPRGTTAALIHLRGKESLPRRGKQPDAGGTIAAVGKDGRSIILAMPPKERGEEPTKVDIQVTDKTTVIYNNVGPNGATLTEGLQAQVWMVDGSKDKAEIVAVFAAPKQRWASLEGRVVGVSKDGKSFTLQGRPMARDEEPTKIDVKISDKTHVSYFGIGTGEAKLTEGYFVRVLLVDGSKDVAMSVMFTKPGTGRR
jgi:RNA polymerase sigma factor (sigma-70 family)